MDKWLQRLRPAATERKSTPRSSDDPQSSDFTPGPSNSTSAEGVNPPPAPVDTDTDSGASETTAQFRFSSSQKNDQKGFPPPSCGAESREERETCCRRVLAAEWPRGAGEFEARVKGVCQWLPEVVVLEKRRSHCGPPKLRWDGDICCHAPGWRWGGYRPSGSGGVATVRQRPVSVCPSGRSRGRKSRGRPPEAGARLCQLNHHYNNNETQYKFCQTGAQKGVGFGINQGQN
ncbi:uncharacterized protein LOC130427217 [Triplophysa dalaica]|uniref:uncharacterized protein LOC130427217 n=1 Tax=Triplophysa dalaica TaxID=1582913 RepID=UPI0024DFA29D|nr:uncharacterized protein LOC130427217 [Triplophysa dalaica]